MQPQSPWGVFTLQAREGQTSCRCCVSAAHGLVAAAAAAMGPLAPLAATAAATAASSCDASRRERRTFGADAALLKLASKPPLLILIIAYLTNPHACMHGLSPKAPKAVSDSSAFGILSREFYLICAFCRGTSNKLLRPSQQFLPNPKP